MKSQDPLRDMHARNQERLAHEQQVRSNAEIQNGQEQSARFVEDMRLLEEECRGAGLGDQFSKVMEAMIQKRNPETPQEDLVKAPPPVKPQVEQYPTKAPPPMPSASIAGASSEMTQGLIHANYPIPTHTVQPTSDAHIISANTSRPAHCGTNGSNNAV